MSKNNPKKTVEEIFANDDNAFEAGKKIGSEIALSYCVGCYDPQVDESERNTLDEFKHGLFHGVWDRLVPYENFLQEVIYNEACDHFLRMYLFINYYLKKENKEEL
jgi:hypothetical protein